MLYISPRFGLQSRKTEQLTKKRSPKIGTDEFPLVESISEYWKSGEGLQIHGFVMLHQNVAPAEGHPALVFAHGGPTGQEIDTFVGLYHISEYRLQDVRKSNIRMTLCPKYVGGRLVERIGGFVAIGVQQS